MKGKIMAGKATEVAKREEPSSELVLAPETKALFASMVVQVPDAEGSGSEAIILAILGAKTWDDVDSPWDKAAKDELIGKDLRIDSIMRRPSSFADGLGVFLVVRGIDMDTKEPIVFATGSVSVVAQLVKLYMLDALPVYAILRKSEKPTARGYYPEHLELSGSAGGPTRGTGK